MAHSDTAFLVRSWKYYDGWRIGRKQDSKHSKSAGAGNWRAWGAIQRGNDRKPVFFEPEDYARYREWLIAAAGDNGLVVHAYVLMTNHVHLLVVPASAESRNSGDTILNNRRLPAVVTALGIYLAACQRAM